MSLAVFAGIAYPPEAGEEIDAMPRWWTAVALLLATGAPAAPPPSADARLRALYTSEWNWRRAEFGPEEDEADAPADHLPRVDPATQARRLAYWQDRLKALDAIPVAGLSPKERVNAAVFRAVLEANVAQQRFRTYEMPFTADSQFWTDLTPSRGYRDAGQYRRYLLRLADIPRWFDAQVANMRAGLARGYSVPRATLVGRDKSFDAYLFADPAKNPLWRPFADMPPAMAPAERTTILAEARRTIAEQVVPAYARLRAFYLDEYLPKARTTLAAEALPDGKSYYLAQIREYTTTGLGPDEIHRIGLAEVARITADMERTRVAAGFGGDLPAFIAHLRTDPRYYAKSGDELLGVSAYVAKRVDGKLKDYFGLLPRYRFTIRPVPDAIAPFYTSGRGGLESCLMNTYDLPSRPLYQTPVLTLHECEPGHSFQAAVALEQPGQPAFRQRTYFSGMGEGWGLYCEWLGTLMGIYRTPEEEFGRESYEMWRAARLVIDTGLHHEGWSRARAIAYLADHTALSQREVENEIDRYISWPGQALAYKLGELSIRRERAKAEKALGARFDQRRFHDRILSLGSVPLPTFEGEMDRWIAAGGPDPHVAR